MPTTFTTFPWHHRRLLSGETATADESTDTGYYVLYFLFVSLVAGAIARGAVRGTRLPYTVSLLFIGLCIGFVHNYADLGVLSKSIDVWVNIGPHTMLSVFLPALVFESAFSLEWHTFRRCASQVLWLAGPGVLFGTLLLGSIFKGILPYSWGWGASLMLGSILSATDPVAVVALLKEVGASKRLGHIIEGESLVNDGTAIVVFSLLNEIAKGNDKTPLQIFAFFMWVPFGAGVVGLCIALGCHAWLGLGAVAGDHIVQISVTVFACYLCFLVAEFQAEASGVLAVVILGVCIGAFGRGFFTGETEHSLHHFWEMLTFIANTVLFILTGVIIAETTVSSSTSGELSGSDIGWGLLVYVIVVLARAILLTVLFPILRRCGYGLTVQDAAVCVWGGLRGAVGLALALVVSEESSHYTDNKVGPIVLLFTGIVVVLTLTVNGTTTSMVLQRLGLTRPEVSVQVAVRKARKHIRDQCLAVYYEHLTTSDDVMGTADFRAVSDLVPFMVEDKDDDDDKDAGAHLITKREKGGSMDKRKSMEKKKSPRRSKENGDEEAKDLAAALSAGLAGLGAAGAASEDEKAAKKPSGMRRMGSKSKEKRTSLDSAVASMESGGVGSSSSFDKKKASGLMTPAPSIMNLAAMGADAEAAEEGGMDAREAATMATTRANTIINHKNVLGVTGGEKIDLAEAVSIKINEEIENAISVWQRDVRGRFLAHLKVLYWEALENGRATKEIVDTLVECTDIALDNLDAPLGDFKALERMMLKKAATSRPLWKRCVGKLPDRVRKGIKWVRQWVFHSGSMPGGGSRRRALVAVALLHDAHEEACHAIFGHDNVHGRDHKTAGAGGFATSDSLKRKDSKDSRASKDAAPPPSLRRLDTELREAATLEETHNGLYEPTLEYAEGDASTRDPSAIAAKRVHGESREARNAARAYLRAARINEPELATAVKSEETARRLLAVAERSARGYVQSGLLTAVEAEELLAGISRAQRRLRLDPPEPIVRTPAEFMRQLPLLDPTHAARVSPNAIASKLVSLAPSVMARRFPGDAVATPEPGALMLLARGVIDVRWARPFGDGGGGFDASVAPLRVGASSTTYGWALGAADLLVPGAARFDMRAVSAAKAFIVPPDVVREILAHAPSAAALWRAAFGLLAATLLRDDLSTVPAAVLRRAQTSAAKISYHPRGSAVGPFPSRREPGKYPATELVVLLKGSLDVPSEGTLEGPCVIVPGGYVALSDDQAEKFGKLAQRMGMSSVGATTLTPEKDSSFHVGGDSMLTDAGAMSVEEDATMLRCSFGKGGAAAAEATAAEERRAERRLNLNLNLSGSKKSALSRSETEKSSSGNAEDRLKDMFSRTSDDEPVPNRRTSIQVGDLQRAKIRNSLFGVEGIPERSHYSPPTSSRTGMSLSPTASMDHATRHQLGAIVQPGTRRRLSLDVRDYDFALAAASVSGAALAAREGDVPPHAQTMRTTYPADRRGSIEDASSLFRTTPSPPRKPGPEAELERRNTHGAAKISKDLGGLYRVSSGGGGGGGGGDDDHEATQQTYPPRSGSWRDLQGAGGGDDDDDDEGSHRAGDNGLTHPPRSG